MFPFWYGHPQFAEGLSDRQAADAVRARIDWKYALSLELDDPGFDYSILSEFRARLITGGEEHQLLEKLLSECKDRGLLKARGKQRTDSTHVLGAIRGLNRLECVGETMRHALNVLATEAPDWLRGWAPPEWYDRYGPRFEEYRLPKGDKERQTLADMIGTDGFRLLAAIDAGGTPEGLDVLPAVATLRRVWAEQYEVPGGPGGPVRWRSASEIPPAAETVHSPYDTEAHYSWKRDIIWTGYKVHLTETCDEDTPHLITHVETTASTMPDVSVTDGVHTALAGKGLLPAQHLVDAGYIGSEQVVRARDSHGLDLIGPVPPDSSWQAREDGFDISRFGIDWEAEVATCPEGKRTRYWNSARDRHGRDVIAARFAKTDCTACPSRSRCTRSKTSGREITLRPRAQFEALQDARRRQATGEFDALYEARAGVEATLSQGIRAFGLRRSRYIGEAKTHLQHVITAVAINLIRLMAWLAGIPRAQTRRSQLTRLAPSGLAV
jgi:transposase